MTDLSRRRFLKNATAASLVALPACAGMGGGSLGKRVRVAVAGVRVQGRRHVAELQRNPDAEVVALTDPDSALLMQAGALVARHGKSPLVTQDPLSLLEQVGIDALVIATPDHWHATLAIRACQAGWHVFVETPVSHSVEEGAAMAEAARANNRLVQSGLVARAHPAIRDAVDHVRGGGFGPIRAIRAICYRYRSSIGRADGVVQVPPHLDFDVWTGPSAKAPLTRRRVHGDWRFDWRTGNGELGEAGTELLDLARWFLGYADHAGRGRSWPDRIWTCGGRLGVRDDGETPNTLLAALDFDGVPVLFDQRNLPTRYGEGRTMDRYRGVQYGLVIEGENRILAVEPTRAICAEFDGEGNLMRQFDGEGSVLGDFIAAIRQHRELSADIEIGRSAADLAHLVNIAHRTGAPGTRVGVLRSTIDDPWLMASFDAMDTHLARNGLDLDHETPILSGWQSVDRVTGELLGNDIANALRRREYRRAFSWKATEGAAKVKRG
jgi:predicted dehydrogenase